MQGLQNTALVAADVTQSNTFLFGLPVHFNLKSEEKENLEWSFPRKIEV